MVLYVPLLQQFAYHAVYCKRPTVRGAWCRLDAIMAHQMKEKIACFKSLLWTRLMLRFVFGMPRDPVSFQRLAKLTEAFCKLPL
jgi:hypothetical protein